MARLEGGSGRDVLYGTGFEDELFGFGDDDVLRGRAGNDVIDGGQGADLMVGWTGNDIYYVDNVGDRVDERADHGTDTVIASIALRLAKEIENLTLVGNVVRGTGNALDNRIVADQDEGGGVRNILNGGGGADIMSGGLGNDTYLVDNAGDQIEEAASWDPNNRDLVYSTTTYTLPAGLDRLYLVGSGALNGTGNDLPNMIVGNGANNVLDGRYGPDDLRGGGGDDTLYGGTNPYDNDRLSGGAGNDSLFGGDHDHDTLSGGAGNDSFYFGVAADYYSDRISDFSSHDDTIYLKTGSFGFSGVLAAEAFVVGKEALDPDDRIIFNPSGNWVLFDRDGSGAGKPIYLLFVNADAEFDHTDFVGYG